MWGVLIAVGVVAVLGVGIAVWFFAAPARHDAAPAGTPTTSSAATPGPVPGATPTTGSEVLPPTGEASERIPPLEPAAPLIAAPLPGSATGEGELVAGYPVDVMGPAAGSDVVQNAIATEGGRMQVSLVARTDAPREEVSRHYSELWASLGLIPQPGGDDAIGYASQFESLSLAFAPASGTGTVYMIHGVFGTD